MSPLPTLFGLLICVGYANAGAANCVPLAFFHSKMEEFQEKLQVTAGENALLLQTMMLLKDRVEEQTTALDHLSSVLTTLVRGNKPSTMYNIS